MTNLQVKLNEEIKNAIKDKDVLKRDTLRLLKGEMERDPNREFSDTYISRLARKLMGIIKESNSDNGEVAILSEFIPKQLLEEDLKELVKKYISDTTPTPKLGQVMGFFKNNYDGLYDGKSLSDITKELLT